MPCSTRLLLGVFAELDQPRSRGIFTFGKLLPTLPALDDAEAVDYFDQASSDNPPRRGKLKPTSSSPCWGGTRAFAPDAPRSRADTLCTALCVLQVHEFQQGGKPYVGFQWIKCWIHLGVY
jgi:hypothetical protein